MGFDEMENLSLEGSNHHHGLTGFTLFSKWSERFKRGVFEVGLVQGFGVGCTYKCDAIRVMSVTPVERED